MKTLSAFLSVAAALLAGCESAEPELRGCTMELRINYCVTLNGEKTVPEDVKVVRIGKSHSDTLDGGRKDDFYPAGNCFPEATQAAVLRVFKGGVLVAEKSVGPNAEVDGCHGKDTVIALTY